MLRAPTMEEVIAVYLSAKFPTQQSGFALIILKPGEIRWNNKEEVEVLFPSLNLHEKDFEESLFGVRFIAGQSAANTAYNALIERELEVQGYQYAAGNWVRIR